MDRISNPNLEILELAVARLGHLVDKLVFLGGCATGLLITDHGAPPVRVTRDVDVITETATLIDYYRLANQLRDLGFTEDSGPDAPICRWRGGGIILDVMPTDSSIFGFGNPWYQPAFAAAEKAALPSGKVINLVTAPYFLAGKFAAFAGRGNGDYLMSHDMEDIVAVLDGRPEIVEEITNCPPELRRHLVESFQVLLDDNSFRDALPGQMPGDAASQARIPRIIQRVKEIAVSR